MDKAKLRRILDYDLVKGLPMRDYFSLVASAAVEGDDWEWLDVVDADEFFEGEPPAERYVGFCPPTADDEDPCPDYGECLAALIVPDMSVGEYVRAELSDPRVRPLLEARLPALRGALRACGSPAAGWGDEALLACFVPFHELGHMAVCLGPGGPGPDGGARAERDAALLDDALRRAEEEAGPGTPEYYELACRYQLELPVERAADEWALAALAEVLG